MHFLFGDSIDLLSLGHDSLHLSLSLYPTHTQRYCEWCERNRNKFNSIRNSEFPSSSSYVVNINETHSQCGCWWLATGRLTLYEPNRHRDRDRFHLFFHSVAVAAINVTIKNRNYSFCFTFYLFIIWNRPFLHLPEYVLWRSILLVYLYLTYCIVRSTVIYHRILFRICWLFAFFFFSLQDVEQ